jgi:hypothetical protein
LPATFFVVTPQMTVEIAILAGIQVDPAINGFWADTHLIIRWIIKPQSGRNSFGRPIESDFSFHIGNKFSLIFPEVMASFMTPLDCSGMCEIVPIELRQVKSDHCDLSPD